VAVVLTMSFRRSAARFERDSGEASAFRNVVGPRSGGVDDDCARNVPARCLGDPAVAKALRREEGRIGPHFAPGAADRGEAGGVKAGDVDVGATRLIPGAAPLLAKPGHHAVERSAIEADEHILTRQIVAAIDQIMPRAGQVKRAATPEQGCLGTGPARIEHRLGRDAQPPRRRVAAKAGLPESDRAPSRMAAAQLLGLDQQHAHALGEARAKACSGNPAADDQDIKSLHRRAGYGFESHSV